LVDSVILDLFLPLVKIGSEYWETLPSEDDDDDDDDECPCELGCCEIRTPMRLAWTSRVAMAPPLERFQSKAFATLEGVARTLINCFELRVLVAAICDYLFLIILLFAL